MKAGDVLFTSRSWPIYRWQSALGVPNPEMTHVAIYIGGGMVYEATINGEAPPERLTELLDVDVKDLPRWYDKTLKGRTVHAFSAPGPNRHETALTDAAVFWLGETYQLIPALFLGRNEPGGSICSVAVAKMLDSAGILELSPKLEAGAFYPGELYQILVDHGYTAIAESDLRDYVEVHRSVSADASIQMIHARSNAQRILDDHAGVTGQYEDLNRKVTRPPGLFWMASSMRERSRDPLHLLEKALNDIVEATWLIETWVPSVHYTPSAGERRTADNHQAWRQQRDFARRMVQAVARLPDAIRLRSTALSEAQVDDLMPGLFRHNGESSPFRSAEEKGFVCYFVLTTLMFGDLRTSALRIRDAVFSANRLTDHIPQDYFSTNGELDVLAEFDQIREDFLSALTDAHQSLKPGGKAFRDWHDMAEELVAEIWRFIDQIRDPDREYAECLEAHMATTAEIVRRYRINQPPDEVPRD